MPVSLYSLSLSLSPPPTIFTRTGLCWVGFATDDPAFPTKKLRKVGLFVCARTLVESVQCQARALVLSGNTCKYMRLQSASFCLFVCKMTQESNLPGSAPIPYS